jgi:hypothetical protein
VKDVFARIVLVVAVAIGGLLGGCSAIDATPINEINTSPANFDDKEVMLHGIAKDPTRIPLLDMKSYVLKDESGEITILTKAELPKVNEKISVRAKVANIAIINGESLGMTVTELARR